VATPHVPLPPALEVEPTFAHAAGYLAQHDPELRLRRSVEVRGYYVLERRCRRRGMSQVGYRDQSDAHIQRRDGYVHVSLVHQQWLTRPWNMLRALKEEGADLFAQHAEQFANELDYEETWAKVTRRRRRHGLFRDLAKEHFDILDRIGNRDGTERIRFNNPGLPAAAPAN
jgi:hypothetical protein